MLSSLTQLGTKALGGRFGLVTMIPGAVVFLFFAGLIRTAAYSPHMHLDRLVAGYSDKSATAAVLLGGVLLAGLVLQPFQIWIVQKLEGYWGGWRISTPVAAVLVEHHARCKELGELLSGISGAPHAANGLQAIAAAARQERRRAHLKSLGERLGRRYPPDTIRLLPTLLGNALRRTEDTAGQRYGLESVPAFPRMFPLLSKTLDGALAQQTNTLDGAAALAAAFGICAVIASPLMVHRDGRVLIPIVAVLLALASYRGAVHAAHQHGVLVATAFDLHRFDLLDAMRLPRPADPCGEHELNVKLSALLADPTVAAKDVLHDVAYRHPSDQAVPPLPPPAPAVAVASDGGGSTDDTPTDDKP